MFDFGKANDEQKNAIKTVDGPLRIVAGPGTGKTFTLIRRAIYMIEERGVKPEQILLATFTEKAAKELVTRITNELSKRSISVNINEMYIGTLHSICLRILKEHLEYTVLKKNYHVLDAFEQEYLVYRNLPELQKCEGYQLAVQDITEEIANSRYRVPDPQWRIARGICAMVNSLTEELVDWKAMQKDPDAYIAAVGRLYQCYLDLLSQNNSIDFAVSQAEAYRLLKERPEILAALQEKIRYLMVDEYQDTNYIQEQFIFLLAGEKQNICVVGDDDQGLYRFRGATIRNILEFEQKFAPGVCKTEKLEINYRSDSSITDFYNKWMNATSGDDFSFNWDRYRIGKTIRTETQSALSCPAVVKIDATRAGRNWKQETLDFIRALVDSGKVTNLNQIAFLFYSVKSSAVTALANFLEKNGINVYSPRSNMFFERREVKQMLGFLFFCFPTYRNKIETGKIWDRDLGFYYKSCLKLADAFLQTPEGQPLRKLVEKRSEEYASLRENTDYAFTGLAYQLFEHEPFKSILGIDMHAGVIDLRPARNISVLTGLLGQYESLHNVSKFKPETIEKQVDYLFSGFLYRLKENGISEYEDESEYAPSGCVSFMTMHQAKGLEFPVTVVGSLDKSPYPKDPNRFSCIERQYYHREPFEPNPDIAFFDFWRLYYTAFSRAQNLLVLTADKRPASPFRRQFAETMDWRDDHFRLEEFSFESVKDVNLKESYSFTSHVALYEECPLRYKFFKELGFTSSKVSATVFGSLVHQTIEDIHRAVLRNERHLLTAENIRAWFETNYYFLSKSEHVYMDKPQKEAAYRQVIKYAEAQKDHWDRIKEAEVDISLVKPDYILQGKIDLIRGEGGTVEIVDFKSEKKPDPDVAGNRIQRYRRQMQVYAHLVEQKTGERVSKLHLYYTGDDSGDPMLTFEGDPGEIESTVREFDETVQKIRKKEFDRRTDNEKTCEGCDFRYYCDRVPQEKEQERRYLSYRLAPGDAPVTWAAETALKKVRHFPPSLRMKQSVGKLFLAKFMDDLAKNIVKAYLAGFDGVSVKEYDAVRCDDFAYGYRDHYDLIVNDFKTEIKGYLEKKVNCPIHEILSKRTMFLKGASADLFVQVVFVPDSTSLADAAEKAGGAADLPGLVTAFCKHCAAYVVGWTARDEENGIPAELPIAKMNGMQEFPAFLQQNKGQVMTCERCGMILERKTNRSTGQPFWGCPNYQAHKKK